MLLLPLVLQGAAMLLGGLTAGVLADQPDVDGARGTTQELPQRQSGGFPSLQSPLEPSQRPFEPSQSPLEPSHPLEPSQRPLEPSQPLQQPSIEGGVSRNVTAVVGMTATLACRVRNIGRKTVSWIRHRDLHLLAVGQLTYTTDQRFVAMHQENSQDWYLKIRYIQRRDAGMYECQISTTPPSSHLVHLSVVEPETVIAGGPDVYINVGSRLVLTCLVKFTPESPAFIFWYHDRKLVSYERTRSSSSSISSSSSSDASRSRGEGEALEVSMESGEVTTSSLLVQAARQSHSGIYTCTPANSRPASVNVHVLQGDRPEAIVHDEAPGTLALHPYLHLLQLLPLLLPLLLLHLHQYQDH